MLRGGRRRDPDALRRHLLPVFAVLRLVVEAHHAVELEVLEKVKKIKNAFLKSFFTDANLPPIVASDDLFGANFNKLRLIIVRLQSYCNSKLALPN